MSLIAVTGASGFIGQELVRRLVHDHSVRCAVRASNSILPEWQGHCEAIATGSIGPQTDWSSLLAGADAVVHLAAIAHGKSSDSELIRQVNIEGAKRLAVEAARHGVKRFVFLSSIGVHGDRTDIQPFNEESSYNPYDEYSLSKCDSERAVLAVGKEHGLEVVIVRPPLVYGPNAPGNFGRLTGLVRRGIPLPFGSIKNKKSLISVRNLTDFIAHATISPAAANQAFVISDGEDVTLPELLRTMAGAMGLRSRVIKFPETLLRWMLATVGRSEDLRKLSGSLMVDASKARNLLAWEAPESLSQGVQYAVTPDRS